jgi:hypothetical protein
MALHVEDGRDAGQRRQYAAHTVIGQCSGEHADCRQWSGALQAGQHAQQPFLIRRKQRAVDRFES